MSIGERVRLLRKELGLNQAQFAEKIGLKQAAIGLYENNQRGVADRIILLICEKYSVREEWLRDGIEPMKPHTRNFGQNMIRNTHCPLRLVGVMLPALLKLRNGLTARFPLRMIKTECDVGHL